MFHSFQDSLGGNSKTSIIATISPSEKCFGETLSTLKFAQRAKLIQNNAVINEDTTGSILQLQLELKRLKHELAHTQGPTFFSFSLLLSPQQSNYHTYSH
jgi:kinesin family protein 15